MVRVLLNFIEFKVEKWWSKSNHVFLVKCPYILCLSVDLCYFNTIQLGLPVLFTAVFSLYYWRNFSSGFLIKSREEKPGFRGLIISRREKQSNLWDQGTVRTARDQVLVKQRSITLEKRGTFWHYPLETPDTRSNAVQTATGILTVLRGYKLKTIKI